MNIQVKKDIPQQKTAFVSVKSNGILQINVYDFPGWHVSIDSKEVSYSSKNALKLLRVPIGRGMHTVTAVFKDTTVRSIGNALSGITMFCIVIFLIVRLRKVK